MSRMLRLRLLPAVLAIVAVAPLAAADLELSDLRLSGGMLSRDFRGAMKSTITDTGNNISTNSHTADGRDADLNNRIQLQYIRGSLGAGGGFVYGIGVAMNRASWDDGGATAHVTTAVADVLLGYGYGLTSNWHVELTPFAGYGRADYRVTKDNATHASQDATPYIEYGGRLATVVEVVPHLLVGIEVPYLIGRFAPKYRYTNEDQSRVTVSDTRENRGFGALATIGYRF